MAPGNVSKKPAPQVVDAGGFESAQESLDPKAISKDVEKNTHARKTQKRNQLSAKYEREMASLDQQALSATESGTKFLADIRQEQRQRLHELVRRRTDVEGEIIQHSKVLEKAYEAANREMRAAARGRLEDLESDNEDGEGLGGQASSVEGRQIPDKEAVTNA